VRHRDNEKIEATSLSYTLEGTARNKQPGSLSLKIVEGEGFCTER
jgi:hypothetical protein